jgi:ferredoxin
MIYYFSGTGNSKWTAETLAKLTNDAALSIPDVTQKDVTVLSQDRNACVGLVFPIYAWGAPEIVEQFAKNLSLQVGAYTYVVCTCGDEAGNAVRRLYSVFPYTSAWSIAMPNNYIPMFDVDSTQLARKKVTDARERLIQIADSIMKKETVYDVTAGSAAWLKSAIACPAFNAFAMRTKPFHSTDACNGCGLCEKNCPVGAIRLENGRPVWVEKNCTQCLACINRCPQRAIEYGKRTQKKGRYYFREG